MKVSFRIRSEYFNAIRDGTKWFEIRKWSDFWIPRYLKVRKSLEHNCRVQAVFVCGKKVLRKLIVDVEVWDNAELALGRIPSDQGKRDLGDGPVIKFILERKGD